MTIRSKLILACESFLRVPPLLVIDEIFRTSFGLGGHLFTQGTLKVSNVVAQTVVLKSTESSTSLDDVSYQDERDNFDPNDSEGLQSDFHPLFSASLNSTLGISSTWSSLFLYFKNELFSGSEELVKNTTVDSPLAYNSSSPAIVETVSVSVGDFAKVTEEFTGDLIKCGEFIASIALFIAAVVMFMLATKNLIKLYSHLLSLLTLYIAYITTPISIAWSPSAIPFIFLNIFFRTVLACLFFATRSYPKRNQRLLEGGSSITSLQDSLLFSLFFLCGVVSVPPVFYLMTVTVLHYSLIMSLPKVYKFLLLSWAETKRVQNEYGLSHLIQVESGRLRINTVFRLFWITRAAYDAFFRCCDEPFSLMIRYVMTHGTETFTGIVGLTMTVAAICHQIGDFLLWLLYFGANNETDANRFGSISTVLFFILSLQSGLTSLDPEKRLDRLMKNIVLLGTALFHALHQMVSPLLHAFRTFQAVQVRAASISCTFLCVSFFLTVYLLRWSTITTWSLAVLALAIEFKIKVIISLMISLVVYLSQLVQYPEVIDKLVSISRRVLPNCMMRFFDQMYDQISHEDMVFYLKTLANAAEFITGIFLFINAVWIFLFESTSAIRAIGMSIHAYFNIWCEAQKGFRIYCQRKTASKKIMSLSDATDEQLKSRNDDVCSICYEGFESAKVTNCGHLFHAVCLRKWLYVQNTCPMCHEILYREDKIDDTVLILPNEDQLPHPQPAVPAIPLDVDVINLSDSEDDNPGSSTRQNPTLDLDLAAGPETVMPSLQRRPSGIGERVQYFDVENGNESDDSSSYEEYTVDGGSDAGELDGIELDSDPDDEDEDDARGIHARDRGLVVFL